MLGLDGDLQCSKKIKQSRVRIKKRALILNAAERVFARYGFSGSRLKEIAKEAGLPKANILYYYKSKEALYRYVCQDILENWLSAIGDKHLGSDEYGRAMKSVTHIILSGLTPR